jgi:acetolactate synthase-1/2/3 large subunit
MNGADLLCETLLAHDIDICFANPGTSEMHFVAALDRQPRMRCVLGLFEGVVTGAADGYARMAGKPAATLLHLGPGAANGLANMHNARKARTGMINVIGDHARRHLAHDAPLTSDIDTLLQPMSNWQRRIATPQTLGEDVAAAIRAARQPPGQIANLILPADCAWGDLPPTRPILHAVPQAEPVPDERVEAVAALVRAGKRIGLLVAGNCLYGDGAEPARRLAMSGRLPVWAETSNSRMRRGGPLGSFEKIAYRVDDALAQLRDIDILVLVGAREPVAFFAYPGKPSRVTRPDCALMTLAEPHEAMPDALARLAEALGIAAATDLPFTRPARPHGPLTAANMGQAIAALLPEGAIICDEAITASNAIFEATIQAHAHDYLQITGGSIGIGFPLATGAALGAPGRKVVCIVGDGSGMYTLQALWTQAREQLDIVNIVVSNRSYAILHGEFARVGAGFPGRNAHDMLDLDRPALDWVSLARGMGVPGTAARDASEFALALERMLAEPGPGLIEAVMS